MKRLFVLLLCVAGSMFLNTDAYASEPVVKTGIEVFRDRGFDVLKGKRVGLVTNPSGVDRNLCSTVDILFNAPEVNLVALYGPEHGVRGDLQIRSQSYLVIRRVDPPKITTKSLPEATVGERYATKLKASGSDVSFSVYYNPGKKNDFDKTGLALTQHGDLEGTPKNTGTFTFTVCAGNEGGEDYKEYTLTVVAPEETTAPAETQQTTVPTEVTVPTTEEAATTQATEEVTEPTVAEQLPEDGNSDGNFALLIIAIIVVAVALLTVAGVVVLVLVIKKKK